MDGRPDSAARIRCRPARFFVVSGALKLVNNLTLALRRLQTILESYKTWVETIVGKHWVTYPAATLVGALEVLTFWLQWTSNLHSTEFLCNAIICTICEAFLIRRCYRVRMSHAPVSHSAH